MRRWDPVLRRPRSGRATTATAPAEQRARSTSTVEAGRRRGRRCAAARACAAPDTVLLVDGVRRVDAGLWTERTGRGHLPGAGRLLRRRGGALRPAPGRGRDGRRPVGRGPVHRQPDAPPTWTAGTVRYTSRRSTVTEPQAAQAVQRPLTALEVGWPARPGRRRRRVTCSWWTARCGPDRSAPRDRLHQDPPAAVPAGTPAAVVTALAAGQRSPVFLLEHRLAAVRLVPASARRHRRALVGLVRAECSADLLLGHAVGARGPVGGDAAPVRRYRLQGPAGPAEPDADRRAGARLRGPARRRPVAAPGVGPPRRPRPPGLLVDVAGSGRNNP